jgi:ubiquinone/menaquinone biosynthesis C-methylase UbiE
MSTPLRGMVHETWAGVAPNWGRYADTLDLHETAVTECMLEAVAVQPGDRVLELACGPGGVGLAAAPLTGADGEVVLSDVAEEMVAIAVDRAHTRGLTNVRGATLDLEDIDQPDACYDVVLCRQGLMFAVHPEQATREIHRVLRPGGRASLAAWGPKAANPWLGIVFDAVSGELGHPVPPPGIPGPFNLEDAARLQATLASAGFGDINVRDVQAPRRWSTFDEWRTWTTALAGPLATILAGIPEVSRTAIVERLHSAVGPYTTPSGVEMPSLARVISARRP